MGSFKEIVKMKILSEGKFLFLGEHEDFGHFIYICFIANF